MSIVNVPIAKIQDNPYQPRREYPEIEELAEKIRAMKDELPATKGLIHVPNARIVNSKGDMLAWLGGFSSYTGDYAVQLAEGHRRLRAFKLLAESDPDYLSMPVNVVDLDDRAMDDIAWDENTARQDLSPVEEARALQRTMERFGLTQADLGARRRMSPSAVSNKIRLLRLPEALLDAVHQGKLTERHGVSYLPILDIPADDLKLANLSRKTNFGSAWEKPTPDALARRMVEIGDLTADQVRDVVERVKGEVASAKKRKWNEQQAAARPAPVMTPVAPAAPKPIPGMPPVGAGSPRPDSDKADSGADEDNEVETGAALEAKDNEAPAALQPIDIRPRDLPIVTVTIRIGRKSDGRGTFTLSAGEAGQFPQFFNGTLEELPATVERVVALFVPKAAPATDGEQILMEMEVSQE